VPASAAASVARWIQERWNVIYGVSGMTVLLRCLGFVFKKAKLVPGKANAEAQEKFVVDYANRKNNNNDQNVSTPSTTR
jgi:hypothetical protein